MYFTFVHFEIFSYEVRMYSKHLTLQVRTQNLEMISNYIPLIKGFINNTKTDRETLNYFPLEKCSSNVLFISTTFRSILKRFCLFPLKKFYFIKISINY